MANVLRDCNTGRESFFVDRTKTIKVPDAATYAVKAIDSGKVHYIPNLTASCTLTLPPVEDGLEFMFVYRGGAADAQNFLVSTGSPTNFYLGGVTHHAAAANAAVFSDGVDDDVLTVVTPSGGTRVSVSCDGLNWLIDGQVMSASAPSFA